MQVKDMMSSHLNEVAPGRQLMELVHRKIGVILLVEGVFHCCSSGSQMASPAL